MKLPNNAKSNTLRAIDILKPLNNKQEIKDNNLDSNIKPILVKFIGEGNEKFNEGGKRYDENGEEVRH